MIPRQAGDAKCLQSLKDMLPSLARVALPINPALGLTISPAMTLRADQII